MKPSAEKTRCGKVVWRVNYTVAKRRVRKTFSTREAARDWITDNFGIASEEGQAFAHAWRVITAKERHELMDALELMRGHRRFYPKSNIVNAVKNQIAREEAIKTSLLLGEAVEKFLATKQSNKRKGSVSPERYNVLKPCLLRVVRDLPEKTLVEFSTEEIEEYLDDEDWSPRPFNNYHALISSVYKWAIANNFATDNPALKIEKYAKKFITKEFIVPAVAVISRVLRWARTPK